ncbi:sodium:proton antiporter [Phycisphaerales bacterium AB-hyl4]|uniref:Sodium:proton antiporter n=1 Tax=Natronomicrosphaera hydrolytica TaxID=3242702 RepID=A0ABV4UAS6_9BACT
MTFVVAVCVAIIFGTGVYMLLGRELKGIAMGVFLLAHAANLSIIAMSGSPIVYDDQTGESQIKAPPVVTADETLTATLANTADPLPQALILTAIVIGFGVMGFLLSMIFITSRATKTLDIETLAEQGRADAEEH